MISLPKLKFDRLPRRALFLSADKLAVYHWDDGKLGSSYLFDVSADGRRYFDHYLKETGSMPTWILVDLVEEEYRQDKIPHVGGADRMAVISRKKARLFRDTPYFCADVQERDTEGRRDDNVLFMALTNPDLLDPWLELLHANKVPLAGIYSVPQITKSLLVHLPDPAANMLVVSLQSISGFRQSFFNNKQLKVSRLVDLPRYGTQPYAPIVHEEIEVLRRYLNSMRLVDIDQTLHVYCLGDARLLGELKKQMPDSPSIKYIFVNTTLCGQQIGLEREITTPFSDELLIHHLLKNRRGNIYAPEEDTRYYKMYKTGRALYASSLCLILAGLIWGGFNFLNAIVHRQQAEIAAKKTEYYNARYQLAHEKLPVTPLSPADLKRVVDIAHSLDQYKGEPSALLKLIGQDMGRFPQIQLDELTWAVSADPNTRITGSVNIAPDQGVVGVSNTENSVYDYYQIAAINGHISPFDGNYRMALELIKRFAESLRTQESVHDVSIVTLPLNINPDASLQGTSEAGPATASFSVRIILGMRHET